MKIYEIREIGGEFEDGYDRLHTAYLSKNKAEAMLIKLKEQMEKDWAQAEICDDCPLYWMFDKEEEFEAEKAKHPDMECVQKAEYNLECGISSWDLPGNYYIKEIEVIE